MTLGPRSPLSHAWRRANQLTLTAISRHPLSVLLIISAPRRRSQHALRLLPGDDLSDALEAYVKSRQLGAACIITCVGSLSLATIRLAGAREIVTLEEELEVVSLVGTLCQGAPGATRHLHIALSRTDGTVMGGHIKGPCTVATTAEVIIGAMPELRFARAFEAATGYLELHIGQQELNHAS